MLLRDKLAPWKSSAASSRIYNTQPILSSSPFFCLDNSSVDGLDMSEKNKALEQQFYTPPPKVGRWESFRTFLWNSETRQFLGRTGLSWAKILLFYVVFYTGLAGFFAAMLAVFYQTLPDDGSPKWRLDNSLIGSNPGLGFRPMPPDSNVESTLIWFQAGNDDSTKYWADALDTFLEEYKKPQTDHDNCAYNRPHSQNKVCAFDVTQIMPCVSADKFNFPKGRPCIFLKLNKIYGWQPAFYNNTKDLPAAMPHDLKTFIEDTEKKNSIPEVLNVVWVSCSGENPADVENLGPINYIPERGFPGYFFPFENRPGYLSPLVAVHFERPVRGVLINIECKAWAHNIKHDRAEQRGSVHFELMID